VQDQTQETHLGAGDKKNEKLNFDFSYIGCWIDCR
jgi:hypothetical protein